MAVEQKPYRQVGTSSTNLYTKPSRDVASVELNDFGADKANIVPSASIFETVKQSDLGASVSYYFDRKEDLLWVY